MYRSVGEDSGALFTDDYIAQATQVTHAPLMRDPPKRSSQTMTVNAVAPAEVPPAAAPSSSDAAMTSAFGDSLVMFGLIGVVAVAGIYFFSRRG